MTSCASIPPLYASDVVFSLRGKEYPKNTVIKFRFFGGSRKEYMGTLKDVVVHPQTKNPISIKIKPFVKDCLNPPIITLSLKKIKIL